MLLTGGTGFVGRSLLRHWQTKPSSRPDLVLVISRNPAAFAKKFPDLASIPWLRVIHGDVTVAASLPSDGYDFVIHGAADSTNGPLLTPLDRFTQIVDGTKNVLAAAISARARRFLLLSSGAVYGPLRHSDPDPEEDSPGSPDPLDPISTYGIAKKAAEHLLTLAMNSSELEVITARCFTFIGPDLPLDVHFAVGNFVKDAVLGRPIIVSGDGTVERSYLDQRDLSRWLIHLACHGQSGEAYNVGSDEAISILQLAKFIKEIVAPDVPIRVLGNPSDNLRQRYVPSIRKVRGQLGLTTEFNLDASIRHMASEIQS